MELPKREGPPGLVEPGGHYNEKQLVYIGAYSIAASTIRR